MTAGWAYRTAPIVDDEEEITELVRKLDIQRKILLWVVGMTTTGAKRILGFPRGGGRGYSWKALLTEVKVRGLTGKVESSTPET